MGPGWVSVRSPANRPATASSAETSGGTPLAPPQVLKAAGPKERIGREAAKTAVLHRADTKTSASTSAEKAAARSGKAASGRRPLKKPGSAPAASIFGYRRRERKAWSAVSCWVRPRRPRAPETSCARARAGRRFCCREAARVPAAADAEKRYRMALLGCAQIVRRIQSHKKTRLNSGGLPCSAWEQGRKRELEAAVCERRKNEEIRSKNFARFI